MFPIPHGVSGKSLSLKEDWQKGIKRLHHEGYISTLFLTNIAVLNYNNKLWPHIRFFFTKSSIIYDYKYIHNISLQEKIIVSMLRIFMDDIVCISFQVCYSTIQDSFQFFFSSVLLSNKVSCEGCSPRATRSCRPLVKSITKINE